MTEIFGSDGGVTDFGSCLDFEDGVGVEGDEGFWARGEGAIDFVEDEVGRFWAFETEGRIVWAKMKWRWT